MEKSDYDGIHGFWFKNSTSMDNRLAIAMEEDWLQSLETIQTAQTQTE